MWATTSPIIPRSKRDLQKPVVTKWPGIPHHAGWAGPGPSASLGSLTVNPFPVAWADLRRSRAGAIAIVLLIGLAVALGVAISAQERALRDGSARAADAFDLIIGAPGSETQLVLSTVYLQPGSVGLIRGSILQDLANNGRVAEAAPRSEERRVGKECRS